MKRKTLLYVAVCCIASASCNLSADKKEEVKTKPVTSKDNTTMNGATIKNDIDIEATGVKLRAAYLVDADYKPLTENKARLGEKIHIVIRMDTGWVKENGKSFIGASEKILAKSGDIIVSTDDIFKEQEISGMDAIDAKAVSFSAMITKPDGTTNDFEVRFRIWDKKSTAEVKGKYYFSLKE